MTWTDLVPVWNSCQVHTEYFFHRLSSTPTKFLIKFLLVMLDAWEHCFIWGGTDRGIIRRKSSL